jgi:hypothetical protein
MIYPQGGSDRQRTVFYRGTDIVLSTYLNLGNNTVNNTHVSQLRPEFLSPLASDETCPSRTRLVCEELHSYVL